MREIKFRVWDEGLKEMIYFDLNSANDTVDCSIYENIMQYTGLKAKNGEIYEGDFLRLPHKVEHEFVEWIDKMWDEEGTYSGYKIDGADFANAEVVGNIYENPELLKEEK